MQTPTISSDPLTNYANFAQFDGEFAGNTIMPNDIDVNCWIIDTGATNHVCANIALFSSYAPPTYSHYVHLPDGTKRIVRYTGTVKHNNKVNLTNVLFVPQFSVNLLSDQETKDNLVIGVPFRRLYIYTHQHDLLVDSSNVVLQSASLPIKFWADAILTATYLLNWTPTKILEWKTPFERLYGRVPKYDHLRIFGSLCYATDVNPHKSKFHSRAIKCILIGYNMLQKSYKLFNLHNQSVLYSRDVHFYEDIFPFSNMKSDVPQPVLPTVPVQSDLMMSPSGEGSRLDQQVDNIDSSPGVMPPLTENERNTNHVLRRSQREIHKPGWLNDFISSIAAPTLLHPCNATYSSFVASLSILQEPRTYLEAIQHTEWQDAMKAELAALESNCTWRLTSLPVGKRPIGCKWVFKTKLKADGTIDRYKARLVAKGFNQVAGVDYYDNFFPVAKTVTVRLFLALAAARAWPLQQMDVNNAFLHGHLEEDLYMTPPEGYSVAPGLVCKLERSIYGLKQASRQWNAELTLKLTEFGFSQSVHDHCLFIRNTSAGFVALLVYVDDILVTAPTLELIQSVKSYLHSLFTIKDLGDARYFLGLEIARNSTGMYVAQAKYVQDIIRDIGLLNARPTSTPFPLGLKLSEDCGALLADQGKYRRLVGRLLYLCFTRPDISHSVQQLSQFLSRPCDVHWKAAVHVVRYLKGSPTKVSRSTAEAEYRTIAATVCELKWLTYVLSDLGVTVTLPIRLFCDNQAALHITANLVFHERTNHIELDCHVVRDAYKAGFISPSFVRSSVQIADLFTKVLGIKQFAFLLAKLGLAALHPSPTCGGGGDVECTTAPLADSPPEFEHTVDGLHDVSDGADAAAVALLDSG
ncbi:UNVERIFIED_CONTAM: Retrovirus-related Pol polyprotein from transposon RE1 [Sesamum radiatum]|uniref:Retrovirus-related Pol polyprotein from transposon RE1 n=1 Tax=Sesamum radiatum TaxID=300843 RepID=A0AAW2TUS6_SESRA